MNSHVCLDSPYRVGLDHVILREHQHPSGSLAGSLAEKLDKKLLESGKERGTSVKTSVYRNSP